ncbi:MAG: heme-copper oxidase subunit III [Candidatus Acidiferrales bacterium]
MDADRVERFISGDINRFAMLLFLLSEAAFFAFLIIAYVYFHGAVTSGPSASNSLDPLKSGMYTVALLASSFTVWRAEKNYDCGRERAFAGWLLLTILLGAILLFGQGREYTHLYHLDVTVSRNTFGTSFFTLTGFHGLHVFLGLIALTILLGVALADKSSARQSSAVRTIATYWHFVDWVWVVIFSIVYLWAFV